MSYSDMKSKIEGELISEPARIAAHVGATLRVTLAGRVAGDAVTPASREPLTLWGRQAGVVWGEPWLTVLTPPCWPHPSAGGLGQVAGGGERHIPHCGGRHPSSRRVSSRRVGQLDWQGGEAERRWVNGTYSTMFCTYCTDAPNILLRIPADFRQRYIYPFAWMGISGTFVSAVSLFCNRPTSDRFFSRKIEKPPFA
jgi:hypothetical protein